MAATLVVDMAKYAGTLKAALNVSELPFRMALAG
jgi:hypothetical protein